MAKLFSESFSADSSANGAWNGAWNGPWNGAWNGAWDGPWKHGSPRGGSPQAATLLREGVIDPADVKVHARPEPKLGARGVARWGRWSASVLLELLRQELLAPLRFKVDGKQAGWVLAADDTKVVRMVPEPSAGTFSSELTSVLAAAQLREERAAEVIEQADGFGAAFAPLFPLPPERLPMTMLLMDALSQLCTTAVMPVKDAFGYWRPHELSPQVQPLIPVPGHATYPAGHAVQAHAAAALLKGLWSGLPDADAKRMGAVADRVADRVAWNRVVAGLHFPVDLREGKLLGEGLATQVLAQTGLNKLTEATAAALDTRQADDLANAAGLSLLQQVARRAWLEWAIGWRGVALQQPAAPLAGGGEAPA